ncbi:hypothetical protein [Alteribacter aurantiacus]|uniref:hypothetical protein n=1 Tax=Alteribacter aurantiacus TaxID=254410 RepID=UPI00041F8A23|nr:hypothetical protein [Alteribacter aurantiacus]
MLNQRLLLGALSAVCIVVWGMLFFVFIGNTEHVSFSEHGLRSGFERSGALTLAYLNEEIALQVEVTDTNVEEVESVEIESITWDNEAINLGDGISIDVVLDSLASWKE